MRYSKLLFLALLWLTPVRAQQSVVIPATTNSIPIAGTIAVQTQIVAGVPGKSIYVTAIDLVPVPTSTVGFTQGTGTDCAVGTTFVDAATGYSAGQTLSKGYGLGAVWALLPGNSLCIIIQTATAPGSLSYSIF